jgi:16S rRNA (cytosine1402-N4)-methyltransferase
MTGHETVLLDEAVDALLQNPDGNFVDCTYGRGGHSQRIVDRISPKGRLMVIDKDMSAINDARQRFKGDERVVVVHGSFAHLTEYVEAHNMRPLSGILLDLGVSSPQLDESERGFSFSNDGPLDMRMDQTIGLTAAQWLARAGEDEITDILRRYGEERFARRIARKIISVREEQDINTTAALVEIIDAAVPRKEKHKHPATRSFQAIRIHINEELRSLEECLQDVVGLLVSGGRLVVISFHSLEDRIVKRFIRKMAKGDTYPDRLPIRDSEIKRYMKPIGKAIKASEAEIDRNRRSRSSIMRLAEKL